MPGLCGGPRAEIGVWHCSVKLLFDQNISFKIAGRLADLYPESVHVRDLDMERSDDREVWDYARDNGFAIASKDEDFHQLSFLYGAPPKVIWLKLGNCTTRDIEQAFREGHSIVVRFLGDQEGSFLVLGSSDA